MLSLAVDTSTPSGSLAVLKDTELLGSIMTCSAENYSSRMFRHLDFLLADLNLKIADFDLFSVNTGPGSFTGLRVGLTAVKGWAELFAKPIAAISGLDAIASTVQTPRSLIAAVLDARRSEVYGALYRSYQSIEADEAVTSTGADRVELRLERIGSEVVMPTEQFVQHVRRIMLDEFSEELREWKFMQRLQKNVSRTPDTDRAHDYMLDAITLPLVVFVTPTPSVVSQSVSKWPEKNCTIHEIPHLLAPAIGRLGYDRAQRGEVVDALHLDANYIRRTDAELLWKGDRTS